MKYHKRRSITSTILKDIEINYDSQFEQGKKRKPQQNSFDAKTSKHERPQIYAEIEQERLLQSDLENYTEFGLVKKKREVKLPVIQKVRSRSTQMKTDTNRNQQSEGEIYTDLKIVKQGSREMKPIFKQIHTILRKHQQKVTLTNNNPEYYVEQDFSNIKYILIVIRISELCNGDEQNIGKLVQQKMEDKRIKYFINLYENTVKYNDEESINQQSQIEMLKIQDKNRRKKVILQLAERKSPKFLYPLGPRIRVPNKNLGDLYFQKPAQVNKNIIISPKINSQLDEICVANLESPPKERYFPTSSMKQDYLDIKVNQIIKSMQHCKIYQN